MGGCGQEKRLFLRGPFVLPTAACVRPACSSQTLWASVFVPKGIQDQLSATPAQRFAPTPAQMPYGKPQAIRAHLQQLEPELPLERSP